MSTLSRFWQVHHIPATGANILPKTCLLVRHYTFLYYIDLFLSYISRVSVALLWKFQRHGKDNTLIVWLLPPSTSTHLSTTLPVDIPPLSRPRPWLLHLLHVNTMNFCSFASYVPPTSTASSPELLIAVPNTLSSETVDIFHLPTQSRIHTVPNAPGLKGGMVMAIALFIPSSSPSFSPSNNLIVTTAYESGHTTVSALSTTTHTWKHTYLSHPHTQPILSLALSLTPNACNRDVYFTSSADANLVKHPIPPSPSQYLGAEEDVEEIGGIRTGGEIKLVKTGHSGQQSLSVRNDGKIFATAGWDGRVRVYSVKNMREVAVLKWHGKGCYAVGFADVKCEVPAPEGRKGKVKVGEEVEEEMEEEDEEGDEDRSKKVERRMERFMVKHERMQKTRTTHWLAVGSKDGKVSLWDIF
ncbi:WD repeat-containing protein-like protein [Calycina marina]|uniref:ASTRA-associated protein 1 n=1 Tax=Calycina marina TaxID=1763456 RepID=A0A9P7YV77_9HELO|nr:WD repeat-containing protein-like protein [Calycina marina]